MSRARIGVVLTAAFCLALPLFTASPASADVIWQTGVKVSHSFNFNSPWATSIGGSTKCFEQSTEDAYGEVGKDGDYVFVKDLCADGRSAMAQVITYNDSGHSVRHRYCRNSHGVGTWARCDFNWPEDSALMCNPSKLSCYNMVLVVGSYDAGSGNLYWDHGNSTRFID